MRVAEQNIRPEEFKIGQETGDKQNNSCKVAQGGQIPQETSEMRAQVTKHHQISIEEILVLCQV